MKSENFEFRSKSQRERDVPLEQNYRKIGIQALAAASHECCKDKQQAKRKQAERRSAGAAEAH